MQLDIRLPIGLMFALLGALLTGFGLITEKEFYQKSLGINVDAWWGVVMLIFGVIMFLLGRRGTATARLTEESPEGKNIEESEHHTGPEK
jgi:multisubunit Na+/H+ antiporter MnhG subunit